MKGITVAMIAGVFCILASMAHAVPPAYEGQFGNPEEPALRVLKWPWLGIRKMVNSTHTGLKEGIQCSPIESIHEGAKGAAHGGCVLLDHTGRGMIYQQLPPKKSLKPGPSYEECALYYIESQTGTGQPPDVSQTNSPAETEKALPAPEGGPYLEYKVEEPAKFKAQRRYVGARTHQRDRALADRKNLLKLAR